VSDHTFTDTVYMGSKECSRCGAIMDPLQVMYSHNGATCPNCRNAKMESHVRQGMSEK
jgi:DNA-directed RNA polymerase subunit RPC12/RpoP